jgi:hypothetical protein
MRLRKDFYCPGVHNATSGCIQGLGPRLPHLRTVTHTSANGSGRRPRAFPGSSLGSRCNRRYFLAVFASIPAFDDAISKFPSVFSNANNLRTCLSVTNSIRPHSLESHRSNCRRVGNFVCRRSGILIVADQNPPISECGRRLGTILTPAKSPDELST